MKTEKSQITRHVVSFEFALCGRGFPLSETQDSKTVCRHPICSSEDFARLNWHLVAKLIGHRRTASNDAFNCAFFENDVAVLTMIASLATPAIEEARLLEAKKLAEVAQLAGDMSHDIKNLLMPVLCGADVLKDELDELFEGRLKSGDRIDLVLYRGRFRINTMAIGNDPTAGKTASTTADQRPALVKTIDGFRDWLSEWRQWARKQNDHRGQASPTIPAPALPPSTRRPL